MANVRLLRQQVDAYQRALEGVNREYKSEHKAYEGKVDAYNAQLDAVKAGGSAWIKGSNGQYELYQGREGQVVKALQGAVPLVNSLPDTGDARYDQANARFALKHNSSGGVDLYRTNGRDYGGWQKIETVVNNHTLLDDAPTAPEEPDAPDAPRFTEKEKGLLMNPTAGPAEMVAANAKGVAVTSSLAGDEAPTKNSAFANPEDPNNLKDRGVLARVLGGQL